jgi:hypothetical protein
MSGAKLTVKRVDELVAAIKRIRTRARDHVRERQYDYAGQMAHQMGGIEVLIQHLVSELTGKCEQGGRIGEAFNCELDPPAENSAP